MSVSNLPTISMAAALFDQGNAKLEALAKQYQGPIPKSACTGVVALWEQAGEILDDLYSKALDADDLALQMQATVAGIQLLANMAVWSATVSDARNLAQKALDVSAQAIGQYDFSVDDQAALNFYRAKLAPIAALDLPGTSPNPMWGTKDTEYLDRGGSGLGGSGSSAGAIAGLLALLAGFAWWKSRK